MYVTDFLSNKKLKKKKDMHLIQEIAKICEKWGHTWNFVPEVKKVRYTQRKALTRAERDKGTIDLRLLIYKTPFQDLKHSYLKFHET